MNGCVLQTEVWRSCVCVAVCSPVDPPEVGKHRAGGWTAAPLYTEMKFDWTGHTPQHLSMMLCSSSTTIKRDFN